MSLASHHSAHVVGATVRVSPVDRTRHCRVPRYVKGCVGRVIDVRGSWPEPGRVLADGDLRPVVTYAVSFDAIDVFGEGEHVISMDLWESDLVTEEQG